MKRNKAVSATLKVCLIYGVSSPYSHLLFSNIYIEPQMIILTVKHYISGQVHPFMYIHLCTIIGIKQL